jgi:hypothetical protein
MFMAQPLTELTESLFENWQQQKFVLLGTIDADTGAPVQQAISWIFARSRQQLRLSVDSRSRIIEHLRSRSECVITVFADETVYAIQGQATIHDDGLSDVPLKLSCIDVQIIAVRDIMYYGSRIAAEPVCEKTYDQRAAEKLDLQVFEAMKKA